MRKLLFLFAIISLCSAYSLTDALQEGGYSERSLYNGFKEFVQDFGTHTETISVAGFKTALEDPEIFQTLIERIRQFTAQDKDQAFITCSKGQKPGFFKFLSKQSGVVGPNGSQTITLEREEDDCFDTVTIDYEIIDKHSVELVFTPSERKSSASNDCKEAYTVGSTQIFHSVVLSEPSKQHQLTFKHLSQAQVASITGFGLRIFKTCDSFSNILPDLLLTATLFTGGYGLNPDIPFFGSKPTWWMELMNPIFIKQGNGYQWERRVDTFVDLDDTEVHAGDYLIITRMDGLDQAIQWGAGSINGHSVTLLEIEGEMYAVESQDSGYWPKRGIQRNKWSEWKKYAQNAGFNVALLPLKPEMRAKFNNTAAVEWFYSVEGNPYGFHNFFFGWIDTENDSLPAVVDINFLYLIFSFIEKIFPSVSNSLIGEAINMRLGTKNLNLEQAYEVMKQKNLTIGQVFAIPEQDSWVYSDGPSMVCSSFVTAIWKAGGLFGSQNIQATEFTPRDAYQLDFFDLKYKKPSKCVHDGLPYCQIMGKFRMDVTRDGYSSVKPYSNMNEHCPTIPPKYSRTEGC